MKRRVKKNDKARPFLEIAEEIGFGGNDAAVEDLRETVTVRECVCEGEIDEEGVVDRVRLF